MDTTTALEARDTWLALAKLVPLIRLYLEPGRTGNSGRRSIPESRLPFNSEASDLLYDIEQAAEFYTTCLLMETHDVKQAPDTIEGMLELIANRHGHWTSDDDWRLARVKEPDGTYTRKEHKLALDFCDDANTLMAKSLALLIQPIPERFMGRCPARCGGDLWLAPQLAARWDREQRAIKPDHDAAAFTPPTASCDQCGREASIVEVREQLAREFVLCVMDRGELVRAAGILGRHIKPDLLRQWIKRGRLVPFTRTPELFRFADFADLARLDVAA